MTARHERVTCRECGLDGAIDKMYRLELYDTPWDDTPQIEYVHKRVPAKLKSDRYFKYIDSCDELLTDSSWADFRYFTCEICGRTICEQNPRNGWHTQVRIVNECEQVCLKCYETMILENGVGREEFESGHLPGMFFSGDNHEPLEAGYTVIIFDKRIANNADAKIVCNKAIELIDSGHKVVIGYERMAIGGLEGYITLFSK